MQRTAKNHGTLQKGARRSQRQIDREMKEEAERIRKENQALLQKEREQMKSSSSTASSVADEAMEELERVVISQDEKQNETETEASHVDSQDKPTTQSQLPSR